MPRTYEPIASTTLGSSASDITFASIAADWTDLVIVLHGANSEGSAVAITFNSDTGSNYSHTLVQGNGTSASSSRQSSQTGAWFASFTTGGPHIAIIHVMSYANTNVYKTLLSSAERIGTTTARHVGLWRSTSAITSVTLDPVFGTLQAGTTASLFGIKAA
jgi:hypothetical protein